MTNIDEEEILSTIPSEEPTDDTFPMLENENEFISEKKEEILDNQENFEQNNNILIPQRIFTYNGLFDVSNYQTIEIDVHGNINKSDVEISQNGIYSSSECNNFIVKVDTHQYQEQTGTFYPEENNYVRIECGFCPDIINITNYEEPSEKIETPINIIFNEENSNKIINVVGWFANNSLLNVYIFRDDTGFFFKCNRIYLNEISIVSKYLFKFSAIKYKGDLNND